MLFSEPFNQKRLRRQGYRSDFLSGAKYWFDCRLQHEARLLLTGWLWLISPEATRGAAGDDVVSGP